MNLILKRFEYGPNYTIGRLYNIDTNLCYILEPCFREKQGQPVTLWKVRGETAIPTGTYKVIITHSPRFGRDLPLLVDVPGFEDIRIHSGNTDKDTEGCLLAGTAWSGTDWVSGSKDALDKVFPLIQTAISNGEEVTITIG